MKDEESAREQDSSDGFAEPAERDELGQAVADLERARTELNAALSPRRLRPESTTGGAAANRGADDAAPAPKADKKSGESSCSTACRAFSSLGRAASAVCRLAGDKDARCTHAQSVLADAHKRVAVCSCRTE